MPTYARPATASPLLTPGGGVASWNIWMPASSTQTSAFERDDASNEVVRAVVHALRRGRDVLDDSRRVLEAELHRRFDAMKRMTVAPGSSSPSAPVGAAMHAWAALW
jgi:hypothetical protein